MASSSRSRRAVACTTVPAGRASSGAPAHWAPCRSRGRGGHAAARRRGSGFRAPGAVIDDPAAQQHPGAGGGGPSIRSPRAPGARAHQVTGPLLGTGGDPHHGRYRRCALGGPAGSRTVRSVLTRSPLGRSSLEGAATWQAIPSSARALASSKPVGPASQRRLDVPVPRPQAGDQRHDLAGITGHRPLNQLTRQRVDRRGLDGTGMNIQSQTCTLGKHRGLLCMSAPRPPNSRNDPRGCIREAPARKPSDPTPIWSEPISARN